MSITDKFKQIFGNESVEFEAPARTEICGNHTDHQNGKVIAAAINLKMRAAAAKREDMTVKIVSYMPGDKIDNLEIDLTNLGQVPEEKAASAALVRGIAAVFAEKGLKIGGFNAVIESDIPVGAGLSSSAAFEVLIGRIFNVFYNDSKVDKITIAKAGAIAENYYFGKPSGLMDQLACSIGGMIYIDLKDPNDPQIVPIDQDFSSNGYELCLVDTGSYHTDLTEAYAQIPIDMTNVARLFGKKVLREVTEDEMKAHFQEMLAILGERPVKRALHFLNEEDRVEELKDVLIALKNGEEIENSEPQNYEPETEDTEPELEFDPGKALPPVEIKGFDKVLSIIVQSGNSSYRDLGNVCIPGQERFSGMVRALDLSWEILQGKGAFRVHGGGFAGMIQAIVPNDMLNDYKTVMEEEFGPGSCYVVQIEK